MSDNTNTPTGNPSKKPTHVAYHVRDGRGEESFWNRIGVAWLNADGKGFNLQLDTIPLDGRITVRIASEPKA